MSVQINHVLLMAHDREVSAQFLAQLLATIPTTNWGPFTTVHLGDGSSVQYVTTAPESLFAQHVAFLVSEERFDQIYRRILDSELDHWADPAQTLPGQFNTNHGGRGVYFRDPGGNGLEILTRPYDNK